MKSAEWYKMFSIVSQIYSKRHNLDIPDNAVTVSGIHIGEWIKYQREHVEELLNSQITELSSFGMIWTIERGTFHSEFSKYINELYQFKTINNLVVPEDAKAKDGFNLYNWILTFDELRELNDDRYMTISEVKVISGLGFRWRKYILPTTEESLHRALSLQLAKVDENNSRIGRCGIKINKRTFSQIKEDNKRVSEEKKAKLDEIEAISKNIETQSLETQGIETDVTVAEKEKVENAEIYSILNRLAEYESRLLNEVVELNKFCTSVYTQLASKKTMQNIKKDTRNNEKVSNIKKNTHKKHFEDTCNSLSEFIDYLAKTTNQDRVEVRPSIKEFKQFYSNLTMYNWLKRMQRNAESLSYDNTVLLNRAFPLWKEKKIVSSQLSLDECIKQYMKLANQCIDKIGYIEYTKNNQELGNLTEYMQNFDIAEYTKEQVIELEAVDFVWLRDGDYRRKIPSLTKYYDVIAVIEKHNMPNVYDTKYDIWYKTLSKSANAGHLVDKRMLKNINKHLDNNINSLN